MLERICQLRIFRAMRTVLTAVAILVLTASGAFGPHHTPADSWEDVGAIRTLWAAAHARSALTSEFLRRHGTGGLCETAPWRPQVLSRPPTGDLAATSAIESLGACDAPPLGAQPAVWSGLAVQADFDLPDGPPGVIAAGPHLPRAPPLFA